MAIDILGDRMHNNVRAVIQWILNVRAQEGVVNHHHYTVPMSDRRNISDVHQAESRIAGRFDPNELCLIRSNQIGNIKLNAGRKGDLDAMSGGHLGEVSVCAAVHI